ncbi:magnesium transport protein CorA [Spirochaetia bacterium]|nr:magnesium transport protein CorA [Spirochaetia bacterium]GHU31483.1 magnesium transport protein CorA [Spirochaetia bacterium]
MNFSIIGYDPVSAWQRDMGTIDEALACRNNAGLTWINVNGLENPDDIRRLTEIYHIHPLTLEDILDTDQRPKSEEFDSYIFMVLKAVHGQGKMEPEFEQISLVLLNDTVITFQEHVGDPFDGIRRRILNNTGRIRKMGTDYLMYAIVDSIVDEYFLTFDSMGSQIEEFEDRALDEHDEAFIPDLQRMKQNLIRLHRIFFPVRESVVNALRFESELIRSDLEPFLKDVLDNIVQAVETVESYRELLSGVTEINLSVTSNRMNRVMKVLTIISTIFIPLTFIVGVYGMNFENMPELHYSLSYPITWGVMVIIASCMLIFFKHRHWL